MQEPRRSKRLRALASQHEAGGGDGPAAGPSSAALVQCSREPAGIWDLPEELLEHTLHLALLKGFATRADMATVCRRWGRVIANSALFWRNTCLSLSDMKVALALAHPKRRQTGLRRQLLAWLRERGRLAQNLHLLECQRMEAELPAMLQALAAPNVRSLRMEACSGSGDKALRALAGMRGLQSLEIDHARRRGFFDGPPGRYSARLLCALSSLENLMLHVPRLEGSFDCVPSAMPGLKMLHVCAEEDYDFALEGITALTALEEMTLTGAVLGPLPAGASRLSRLTSLNLSETRNLTPEGPTFWDTLPLLPTLRSISTRHCDMAGADLSQGVLAVTSLQALELSSYLLNLPELPLGALPELSSLVFEGCHLQAFPASWCRLPSLHTLKFKSAPPDSLPVEVTQLTSLRDLTLEGGLTRSLMPCCALGCLTHLKVSHMDFLSSLPEGPYLTSLLSLDCSHNRFLSLPPSLALCSQMTSLDFSHNSRLQLDAADVRDVLQPLSALRVLHLHKDSTLCEVGASPWDLRSVQALMQLAAARPDLTVCLDGGSCLRAVGAEAAAAAGGSGDVPHLPAPEA